MNVLIDECIEKLKNEFSFRVTYRLFLFISSLRIDEISLNLDYPDLNDLFQNCHDVVIIGCTLGLQVEKRSHYYSHIDMTKAAIFDAVASSFLEVKM